MSNGAPYVAAKPANQAQSNHPTVPSAGTRRDECGMDPDIECSFLSELSFQFRNTRQVVIVVLGDEEDEVDNANILFKSRMQSGARD